MRASPRRPQTHPARAARPTQALKRKGCGPGSSSERTRTAITGALKKKLKDLMGEFQDLRWVAAAALREMPAFQGAGTLSPVGGGGWGGSAGVLCSGGAAKAQPAPPPLDWTAGPPQSPQPCCLPSGAELSGDWP